MGCKLCWAVVGHTFLQVILISCGWLASLLTEPQMLCLYIYIHEEQIIGPIEMALKFNFRIRHLMFTGSDQNI